MYKHILLPTDGSKLSEKAIKHGVALAKALKAKITAVTVSPPLSTIASESVIGTDPSKPPAQYLGMVRKAAAASKVACDVMHVENDQPHQAIIAAAKKQKCDLIVMASHGRRGISALVLGSVTAKVLTHSTIPVLVYR
jgi:nucleotide-binding universal stress UspA family protein